MKTIGCKREMIMIIIVNVLLGVVEEPSHRRCPDTVLQSNSSHSPSAQNQRLHPCAAGRLQKSYGMNSDTSKHGQLLGFQNQRGYHRKSALLVSGVRGTTFPDGNENAQIYGKKMIVKCFLGAGRRRRDQESVQCAGSR